MIRCFLYPEASPGHRESFHDAGRCHPGVMDTISSDAILGGTLTRREVGRGVDTRAAGGCSLS